MPDQQDEYDLLYAKSKQLTSATPVVQDDYDQLYRQSKASSTSVFDSIKDEYQRKVNQIKNIGNVVSGGMNLLYGMPLNDPQKKAVEAIKTTYHNNDQGQVSDQVASDIGHMFSKTSIVSTAKSLWDKTKGIGSDLVNDPGGTLASGAKSLAAVPYKMIDGLASNIGAAVTGVDASGNELRALSTPEQAQEVKGFIGNAVAAAVAPVISKAVGMGLASGIGDVTAASSAGEVAQVASANTMGVRLGVVGRTIAEHVAGAAGAGVTQGAISQANTPDVIAAAATGLLFAPLGVITGYLGGLKQLKEFGPYGAIEKRITQAKFVQDTRNFQEVSNASVDAITDRLNNFVVADNLDKALIPPAHDAQVATWWDNEIGNQGPDAAFEAINNAKAEHEPNIDTYGPEGIIRGDSGERSQVVKRFSSLSETNQNRLKEYHAAEIAPTPDEVYNTHYDAFKAQLNENENFTTTLVNYAEKNGLIGQVNELGYHFAEKYMQEAAPKEMAHLRSLQKDIIENMKQDHEIGTQDLVDHAAKAGFYVTNNHGALEIRDISTGDIINTASTSKEALELMRQSGRIPNAPQLDNGGKIPTDALGVEFGPAIHTNMQDDYQLKTTNLERKVGDLDINHLDEQTGIRTMLERVDTHTTNIAGFANEDGTGERVNTRQSNITGGTDFKQLVYAPLERAKIQARLLSREYENKPVMRMIDAHVRAKVNGITMVDREHVGNMLETNTIENMMKPDGYQEGYTIPQAALDHATFLHEEGIDAGKVQQFRRLRDTAKYKAIAAARKLAADAHANAIDRGADPLAAKQAYDAASADYESLPSYQTDMNTLMEKFAPDANFMKGVDGYDKLYEMPNHNGIQAAASVARLKLALDDPTHYGITKEDYITTHNIRPAIVDLHTMVNSAYDYFGSKFGMDGRKMMQYMNHFRQLGDISDSIIEDEFSRGLMDGSTRRFTSDMIRSGEITNYSKDAVGNLYSYIRGGAKRGLYDTIDQVLGADNGPLAQQMAKVQNLDLKKRIKARFEQYQRDITGQQSLTQKQAMTIHAEMLSKLVDENGAFKSKSEIIQDINSPNSLDTVMNLMSSSYLGGRVSLAGRDLIDTYQKYFIRNGLNRTFDMLKRSAPDLLVQQLIQNGDILDPTPSDMISIGHSLIEGENIPGKTIHNAKVSIHAASKELAQFGFETSLQHQAYMRSQVAAFLETNDHVTNVLKDLQSNKISKAVAYDMDHIHISQYDLSTQRLFEAFVKDDNIQSAARLLAKEEVVATVGDMSRGNQAPMVSSVSGKLMGQLASWGMANRSVFENMLTRGSTKEVARSMVRYAITLNGGLAAGTATGLNLGRWLLLPTSLIATGGPALSAASTMTSMAVSNINNDQKQTNFTNRAAETAAMGFLPFSYMTRDLVKGVDMAANGSGYGVMRPVAQALGIGVNTTERNFLDIITGNWPSAPDHRGQ